MKKKLISLIIFGIAFGLLEAIVVFYLQHIVGHVVQHLSPKQYSVILDLKAIMFILPKQALLKTSTVGSVEMVREFSTIVMLLTLAYTAGNTMKQRIGAFMLAFAIWDIFYYVFLYMLTGWPTSLLATDIFFLIPVPWIGPVITPAIISLIMAIIGGKLYLSADISN